MRNGGGWKPGGKSHGPSSPGSEVWNDAHFGAQSFPEGSKRQQGLGDKAQLWKQKTGTMCVCHHHPLTLCPPRWEEAWRWQDQASSLHGLLSLENGDNTSH